MGDVAVPGRGVTPLDGGLEGEPVSGEGLVACG